MNCENRIFYQGLLLNFPFTLSLTDHRSIRSKEIQNRIIHAIQHYKPNSFVIILLSLQKTIKPSKLKILRKQTECQS